MFLRDGRTHVPTIGAVARQRDSSGAHRMQPRRETLTVACHTAAARREEHADRAALDEQRGRAQAEAAQAARDRVQPARERAATR